MERLKKYLVLFFAALSFSGLCQQPSHGKKVLAYYAQWSIYARDFNIPKIDGSKITHLMYAFFGTKYDPADPAATKLLSLDTYADFEHTEGGIPWNSDVKGNFYDLRELKKKYPNLKIVISVGGWTKSQNFPSIAASSSARDALAKDMADFIVKYPFIDGFDIDWEFPITGGTDGNELIGGSIVPAQPHTADDNKNLVYLLKAMRKAMPDKFLSIAAGNSVENVTAQFIGTVNKSKFNMVDDLSTYCDLISFFGYDFGGNWYDKTSYNAPLYGSGNVNDPLHGQTVQSLDVLVDKFLNQVGIPKEKLVMGVPAYGKLFDNVADSGTVPGLPGLFVSAPRVSGGCTVPQPPKGSWDSASCENTGSIEFCDLAGASGTNAHHLLDPAQSSTVSAQAAAAGWVRYWDDTAKVPYLYNQKTRQFISYDDNRSIEEKARYILAKGLAGAMLWELSQDIRPVLSDGISPSNSLLSSLNNTFSTAPVTISMQFKTPDNKPLAGVNVVLKKIKDSSSASFLTAADGSVIFSSVEPFQQYEIVFSKQGFIFQPAEIAVSEGELANDAAYSVYASDKSVALSGKIAKSDTLDPIAAVKVKLLDSQDNVVSTLDSADGSFVFSAVIAGLSYKITAEKLNYDFQPVYMADVGAGQNDLVVKGTFVTYILSGSVMDGQTALQGVKVSVSGNGMSYTAETAADGSYTLKGLPSAVYTVSADKTGMSFLPKSYSVSLTSNSAVDFKLDSYLVSGYVKNGAVPISGAKIEIVLPYQDGLHPWISHTASTDSQGRYFFDNSIFQGYKIFSSIKTNSWDNGGVSYFPSGGYGQEDIPVQPKEYNFNTQSAPVPEVSVIAPNSSVVTASPGAAITLSAKAGFNFSGTQGTSTIVSVIFSIAGVDIAATKNSDGSYTALWTPGSADFFKNYTLKVTAVDSNNASAVSNLDFTLNCTGSACPNQAPVIVWNAPSGTTINQAGGFVPVNIQAAVSDNDGTVKEVKISIDGAVHAMVLASEGIYTYSFTPGSYKNYSIDITASDNLAGSSVLSKTIKITQSAFVPLPEKVILGYVHSWNNASAPFVHFSDLKNKKYNVVVYSFIETVNQDGFTPVLTYYPEGYMKNGVYDKQLLIDDIQSLRAAGIPVLVSIGGANGHVSLNTEAQKQIFVSGLKAIIDEYHFDGIDMDFEGGSMNYGAGSLKDFSYSAISSFPKLKNIVDAFKEIKQFYGSGFILTAAPEDQYVQGGAAPYGTYSDTFGSFLPIIHNLRSELDLLQVQLYNSGGLTGPDGKYYAGGSIDYVVLASDYLLKGFYVGSTGFYFNPLPASKILVGLPSCSSAGGGYIELGRVVSGLDYITRGVTFDGRKYTMQPGGPYPDLRGMMTWSVNWDLSSCGSDKFASTLQPYFFNKLAVEDHNRESSILIAYLKSGSLNVSSEKKIVQIRVYNLLGQLLVNEKVNHLNSVQISSKAFDTKQFFILEVLDELGGRSVRKIY